MVIKGLLEDRGRAGLPPETEIRRKEGGSFCGREVRETSAFQVRAA